MASNERPPPTEAAPTSLRSTSIVQQKQQEPWLDPEWQRLWLSVQARSWNSLALVPAGEGANDNFTVLVAVILSRTGMVHLGAPIQVADATKIILPQLAPFLEEVNRYAGSGERVVIALPPSARSPITVNIAQATDTALLCVLLERMAWAEARRTVARIGASRFLGSAIFHPHQVDKMKVK